MIRPKSIATVVVDFVSTPSRSSIPVPISVSVSSVRSGRISLTAPTSGPFDGLLLLLPSDPGNAPDATVTLNGNSTSTITGTIMAMSADVSVEGTGASGIFGQIIGYTIDLTGASDNSIIYNDAQNYDALKPGAVEQTQ